MFLYLNNTHARVEKDGSFGILGGVLVLVEVEVVGSISQLGQMEVPPLEGLKHEKKRECTHHIWPLLLKVS